ncbi:tRNA methyltransferase [Armadillidium nasatum]|uniref:tRNA methyltransferase n=1 Tax=Armadillidium nasatum TaxID=96803 RepID=A0A5N5SNJ8_9CRUS|nr:tRNA methyltransferase [Armadillidium nasatum]
MSTVTAVTVLELFSGIGGMHIALQETGKLFHIVSSYEINPTALAIYNYNFGHKHQIKERNIMGMNAEFLENLHPDLIVMSPPCQPFTRQGLKKDTNDARCSPLLHIISLLKSIQKLPQMILLENVSGFECSEARKELIQVLKEKEYIIQEYMLTPSQFGIPNSRLRYFLLAKHSSRFCFHVSEKIESSLPVCTCYHIISAVGEFPESCSNCKKTINQSISLLINKKLGKLKNHDLKVNNSTSLQDLTLPISHYLENLEDPLPFLVKKNILQKYAKVFDIVNSSSKGSCCFTKGYSHYVQGTGSVYIHNPKANLNETFKALNDIEESDKKYEDLLLSLQLRYFTPREVLRLMGFPESFDFPNACSNKQLYKVLGNSVNVFIVTLLLLVLLE